MSQHRLLPGSASVVGGGVAIDPAMIGWWKPDAALQYMSDTTNRNAPFDLGSAVTRTVDAGVPGGYVLTAAADWAQPQTLNGWQVPGGFTNTGICVDTVEDCLLIGDFTNNKIVKVSRTGALIGSISITAQPQGVTLDTSDNTIWWSDYTNKYLRHITKAGADAGGSINLGAVNGVNGCAYEAATDSIWIVPGGTNTILRYSCADGSLQETLTVTGYVAIDGLGYDVTTDTLWITGDNPKKIANINSTTGAVISEAASGNQPEGIGVDTDGTLWYCDDAQYHDSTKFGNRVYHLSSALAHILTPHAIVLPAIPFTIDTWFRVTTTGGAIHTVFWAGDNTADVSYVAILLRGDASNAIQAWHRGGGNAIASAAIPFVEGTLYRVTAVFASNSSRLIYVNGANVGSDATSRSAITFNSMAILQSRDTSPGSQLVGNLGQLRIWNRALSADEIAAL
jgi:hypothetical protein